ncbi:MAG: hypothetical protein J7539_10935 [Niabella sp.]|nr:hypothetical protein [Niabella sp.]
MTLLYSFFDLLRPDTLYRTAWAFVCLILILLLLIYWSLYKRKRVFFQQKSFRDGFEEWLSELMMEEEEDEGSAELPAIPEKFTKHFKNPVKRQFAVDILMDLKKSVSGSLGDNIINLYLQLGFKDESVRKLRSRKWYEQVKGINELSVMKQEDSYSRIFKFTNDRNIYVRREAQTALFSFSGFGGLRFLNVLTYPMSEWQQLNLIEQLRPLNPEPMPGIPRWLRSDNDTVVLFALKLAEIYQCFEVHDDVAHCLQHKDEKIRNQAVKTLREISNETTAALLCDHYPTESLRNKINILNNLNAIAGDEQLPFLVKELDNENEFLKLGAGRVMINCCSQGLEVLEAKAAEQPVPFGDIYNHLIYEIQR